MKTVKNHAKIAENYEKPCENTSEPLKTCPGTLESAERLGESRKSNNSTLADAMRIVIGRGGTVLDGRIDFCLDRRWRALSKRRPDSSVIIFQITARFGLARLLSCQGARRRIWVFVQSILFSKLKFVFATLKFVFRKLKFDFATLVPSGPSGILRR